jgi:hypothetical protein
MLFDWAQSLGHGPRARPAEDFTIEVLKWHCRPRWFGIGVWIPEGNDFAYNSSGHYPMMVSSGDLVPFVTENLRTWQLPVGEVQQALGVNPYLSGSGRSRDKIPHPRNTRTHN